MGSTGDPPVPVGDSPTGRSRRPLPQGPSLLGSGAIPVPPGGLPGGTAFKNKEQNPSTFARSALDVVKLNADDAFLKRFVASHNFVAFCFLFITPRGDDEKRSSPNLTLPGTLAGPELR